MNQHFKVWLPKEKRWCTCAYPILQGLIVDAGEAAVHEIAGVQDDRDGDQLIADGDVVIVWASGELDKNHREFYVGDIVKAKTGSIWLITYEHGSFGAELRDIDLEAWGNWLGMATCCFSDSKFEIIGNVYDNPKLLPMEAKR